MGCAYEPDGPVIQIPHIGKKTAEKLADQGIFSPSQLRAELLNEIRKNETRGRPEATVAIKGIKSRRRVDSILKWIDEQEARRQQSIARKEPNRAPAQLANQDILDLYDRVFNPASEGQLGVEPQKRRVLDKNGWAPTSGTRRRQTPKADAAEALLEILGDDVEPRRLPPRELAAAMRDAARAMGKEGIAEKAAKLLADQEKIEAEAAALEGPRGPSNEELAAIEREVTPDWIEAEFNRVSASNTRSTATETSTAPPLKTAAEGLVAGATAPSHAPPRPRTAPRRPAAGGAPPQGPPQGPVGPAPPGPPAGPPLPPNNRPVGQDTMAPFFGENVVQWLQMTAQTRMLKSPAATVRKTMSELVIPDYKTKAMYEGEAAGQSAESAIKNWRVQAEYAFSKVDQFYWKYALGVPEGEKAPLWNRVQDRITDSRRSTVRGKMSRHDFFSEVGYAMTREGRARDTLAPDVREAVEAASQIMRDEFYDLAFQRAQQAGINLSRIRPESYLPRRWKMDVVSANPGRLISAVYDDLAGAVQASTMSATAKARALQNLRATIEAQVDQLQADPYTRLQQQNVKRHGRASRTRTIGHLEVRDRGQWHTFEVNQRVLEPYLNYNIAEVTHSYLLSFIPDIEITRKFGDVNMTAKIGEIQAEYDELISATPDLEQKRWLWQRQQRDIEDIKVIRDVLRGVNTLPQDPYSVPGRLIRSGRLMRNLTFMRVGGNFGIVSLQDVASMALINGVHRTMGAFLEDFGVAGSQAAKLLDDQDLEALKVNVSDTMHHRASSVYDAFGYGQSLTMLEHWADIGARHMGVLSLLEPWTNYAKHIAARTTLNRIARIAKKARDGTITADELANAARADIGRDDLIGLATMLDRHGIDEGGRTSFGVESWDINDPGVMALKRKLRHAVVTDVDRAVVTPGASDTPNFLHTEQGKFIFQFRRFGLAHTQKVLIPALQGLQAGDRSILGYIALSSALGAGTYILKTLADKREVDLSPWRLAQEGVVRSDIWGTLGELDGKIGIGTGGLISMRGFLGPDTYYGTQKPSLADAASNILGPNFDTLKEIKRAATAVLSEPGSASDREVRAMRRVLPYQNLFYTNWLFDIYENTLVDTNRRDRKRLKEMYSAPTYNTAIFLTQRESLKARSY